MCTTVHYRQLYTHGMIVDNQLSAWRILAEREALYSGLYSWNNKCWWLALTERSQQGMQSNCLYIFPGEKWIARCVLVSVSCYIATTGKWNCKKNYFLSKHLKSEQFIEQFIFSLSSKGWFLTAQLLCLLNGQGGQSHHCGKIKFGSKMGVFTINYSLQQFMGWPYFSA